MTQQDAERKSLSELEKQAYAAPNGTMVPIEVVRAIIQRIRWNGFGDPRR